jgi:hypothetical protein
MQNVPLEDIVWNPWRDVKLYPIDDDHVKELRASIKDHGFFGGIKGRRRNGKVEIGCGHARIAAARKAKIDGEPLETVPIWIDDIDDDTMLRLMTDENATQAGSRPASVMNEVEAVTKRLVSGLRSPTIVGDVARAFESKLAIEAARTKIQRGSAHLALGEMVIRRYLGDGNPDRSPRGARQIREAIGALKQSGRYAAIVEEELLKYPEPVLDIEPAKGRAVSPAKPATKPRRILDEKTANVFKNDHQFQAFREAITTQSAQKMIPVSEQLGIAKEIMSEITSGGHKKAGEFNKKQVGAPYIKAKVQVKVEEAMKEQRKIDKEERDRYLHEQIDENIAATISSALSNLRGLISGLLKLTDLARQNPAHPKLGGFSARLDQLVGVINQFSKALR